MSDFASSRALEEIISAAVEAPEPGDQFLADLGQRLDEHARRMPRPARKPFRRPVWQIALAFLVVLALIILAIGPQRVLAQVQDWLGYTGWFGFFPLDQSLVLSKPVQQEQDGLVFTVTEAIAAPDKMTMRLTVQNTAGDPQQLDVRAYTFLLRLADHTVRYPSISASGTGEEILEYPALPAGERQVTLEIKPGINSPSAGWVIPLAFKPASQSQQKSGWLSVDQPVHAYTSFNGIDMDVLAVVRTGKATAIQVRYTGQGFSGFERSSPARLFDDLGHEYQPAESNAYAGMQLGPVAPIEATPLGSPAAGEISSTETYTFMPLSPSAGRAILKVDEVNIDVMAEASFTFDPGPNPQIGQSWDLNQTIDIAGTPLHFSRALLNSQPGDTQQGEPEKYYVLTFWADSPRTNGRQVSAIQADFSPSPPKTAMTGSSNGMVEIQLFLRALPAGTVKMEIHEATLTLPGPWTVAWDLPQPGEPEKPVVYAPDQAVAVAQGITLAVKQVVASDSLTWIGLSHPQGLPANSTFGGLENVPAGGELYLQTADGQRYEPQYQVTWNPARKTETSWDPLQLNFAAIPAGARALSLNIPAIRYAQAVAGSFAVEIPSGLSLSDQDLTLHLTDATGKTQAFDQNQPASQPWAIDVTLVLGDQRVHLDQAQLVATGQGADRLIFRGAWAGSVTADRRPLSIRIARITLPDGQRIPGEFQPGRPEHHHELCSGLSG